MFNSRLHNPLFRFLSFISILSLLFGSLSIPALGRGDYATDPTSVTIVGSLQSELSCPGDWQPECAATHLTYDPGDDVWQGTWTIPAGAYEYKAALNDGWTENYGLHALAGGLNIPLNLAASSSVKFYYDHKSHWVTENQTSVIAVAPGDFQSELGCGGDWDPSCLRSWLQDPDGDGVYTFETTALPVGDYQSKVAINEGWSENYGQGGVPGGLNIPFSVAVSGSTVKFSYTAATHVPDIQVLAPAEPTVTLVGSLQSELSCAVDWDPACAATHLTYDANDEVWQGTWTVPAGSYEYKAALNDNWDVSYGLHAQLGGANIPLAADDSSVKFYFDPKSHWVTDSKNSVIAVAPGSFQSELGCSGDWDPGCLRSWLQDIDGDGVYTLETTALPAGSYEGKVALNEGWDVNYGQGGVPGGANISFFVPFDYAKVSFKYVSSTHVLTILSGFMPDNDIAWDGLRHDSRDLLYRSPGGAVPAGTPVLIRFRTFHNDVTGVSLRVYDINLSAQKIVKMTLAATDVSCYQAGLEQFTCDFWQATANEASPNNLWYRFIVTDGTDTDYYGDNTAALDGGLGSTTDDPVDNSFALMVYDPAFTVPVWAKNAVIYQIFPDRFFDGRKDNNAKTGDLRYDDPVLRLAWGTLPEGYCRNYAGATPQTCPWRFDKNQPVDTIEQPRGRDYMGGDLKGIDQSLDYLKILGVNTLYFNPVFDSASNHGYDTQDYMKIDPYFGTQKDWENLVKHANKLGMRIVLDGVFNHLSSDSPFFDRYHHYSSVGACESADSPYRSWFHFRPPASNEPSPCAPSTPGGKDTFYDGWFGFDSIPVINKSNPAVQAYFLTGKNNVTSYWLKQGASAWRMDVMGDSTFPNGYWETFRNTVKATRPDALIIGELWQKDSTLLRFLRGDRADSTMNYRLRDAVLGLLAPQSFDSKGFPDSGRIISPTEFASRLSSIQEDYPSGVFYSLMNLVDSHDTERILWTLTPGSATTAEKELNVANLAEGKQRLRIASLIQFTLPGAPTVYYGDEVSLTGDTDPDDRRTYPWYNYASGIKPDTAMFSHYMTLANLRRLNPVLTSGDLKVLFTDDATGVVAYGRKTTCQAAVVIINRSNTSTTGAIPVAGYLPDGVVLKAAYKVGSGGASKITVTNGELVGSVGPMSAVLLLSGTTDLLPPAAPTGLSALEGIAQVSLTWNSSKGALGYNVYRSPLSGGGFVKLNSSPLTVTFFTDTGLDNAKNYHYVVTALDKVGNESGYSNEVVALPHLTIGWANLQWPPTLTHTISALTRTDTAYGQVWIDGVTNQPGQTPTLRAQLGFGPVGSNPALSSDWAWVEASFNVDAGSNDEFMASLLPESEGSFDYLYRYTTTDGRNWTYADLNGLVSPGALPANPGKLTVNPGSDTTAPAVPTGLKVVSFSPAGISLDWDDLSGDPSLYGYEVGRSDMSGGSYTPIARVTSSSYNDLSVMEGATYYYAVRAVDNSFNRSVFSSEVSATAALRIVTLTFNVTVPASTDGTGRLVYIAGFLDRLNGGLPQWNANGVVLTRMDATTWTITLTGYETIQIEYKYTLGDWEHVEKDNACGEIANRQLTLSYGSNGTQIVNDTVANWRNVSPCGN